VEEVVARAALVVIAIGIGLVGAYFLRGQLILMLLALLLAAALHSPVGGLERLRLPRVLAIITTYLAVLLVIVGVLGFAVPPLVRQGAALFDQLPEIANRLFQQAVGIVDEFAGEGTADEIMAAMPGLEALPTGQLVEVPLTIASLAVDLFFIIFLSALMLLERDRAWRWVSRWVGPETRDPLLEVSKDALQKLGAYVRGQLLIMAIVGVGTGIGMAVLGVPFPVPLGLLAFLTEAIPLVGPYISGIPILALAFLESPETGILMTVWIVVLQQVESLVLVPMIQSKVVELSPLIVLVAVIAGTTLAGLLGAVLAVPVVAAVQVVSESVIMPLRQRARDRSRDGPAAPAPSG
jgi:putative heme transporter